MKYSNEAKVAAFPLLSRKEREKKKKATEFVAAVVVLLPRLLLEVLVSALNVKNLVTSVGPCGLLLVLRHKSDNQQH